MAKFFHRINQRADSFQPQNTRQVITRQAPVDTLLTPTTERWNGLTWEISEHSSKKTSRVVKYKSKKLIHYLGRMKGLNLDLAYERGMLLLLQQVLSSRLIVLQVGRIRSMHTISSSGQTMQN